MQAQHPAAILPGGIRLRPMLFRSFPARSRELEFHLDVSKRL
jgi:hypothetical protein